MPLIRTDAAVSSPQNVPTPVAAMDDPGPIRIIQGDSLDVLRTFPDNHFTAIVTDPPANIGFMGKHWDNYGRAIRNPAFGNWLSGFVDGEGCFRIHRERSGEYYACHFSIKLQADDRAILERIRSFIGVGRIESIDASTANDRNASPAVKYLVDTRDGCKAIRDVFLAFPLRAKKVRDFRIWLRALSAWERQGRGNRWHGPADKSEMERLWLEMKTVRPYTDETVLGGSGNPFIDQVEEIMVEALRVCRPGAHALVWAIPRTSHWTATACENAGWEIRDRISHLFGSGFPKSMDVGKAFDRLGGVSAKGKEFKEMLAYAIAASNKSRKQIDEECGFTMRYDTPYEKDQIGWGCTFPGAEQWDRIKQVLYISDDWDQLVLGIEREVLARQKRTQAPSGIVGAGRDGTPVERSITAPATDAAKLWDGYGTALKPAMEDWWLLRKPLEGTVAQNVQKWGCGALWIDGCRVEYQDDADKASATPQGKCTAANNGAVPNIEGNSRAEFDRPQQNGRWPAHLTHDGSDEVLSGFPDSKGQQGDVRGTEPSHTGGDGTNCYGEYGRIPQVKRGDSGSAARFFYCSKASRKDRGTGNSHPTCKSTTLMEWLCNLIRQPETNLYVDPFCGSGSTLVACQRLGLPCVGIEREAAYVEIARSRL